MRQDNIIKDKTRQVLECSSCVVGMTIRRFEDDVQVESKAKQGKARQGKATSVRPDQIRSNREVEFDDRLTDLTVR